MKTCGYCGTNLQEHYCSFCELTLDEKHVLDAHKRVNHVLKVLQMKQRFFFQLLNC